MPASKPIIAIILNTPSEFSFTTSEAAIDERTAAQLPFQKLLLLAKAHGALEAFVAKNGKVSEGPGGIQIPRTDSPPSWMVKMLESRLSTWIESADLIFAIDDSTYLTTINLPDTPTDGNRYLAEKNVLIEGLLVEAVMASSQVLVLASKQAPSKSVLSFCLRRKPNFVDTTKSDRQIEQEVNSFLASPVKANSSLNTALLNVPLIDQKHKVTIIDQTATKYMEVYKKTYSKEVKAAEEESKRSKQNPFAYSMPKPEVQFKEITSIFNSIRNQVLGRLKSLKVETNKSSSTLDNYTLAVLFTLISEKMLKCEALEQGFASGKIMDAESFQNYFNLTYVHSTSTPASSGSSEGLSRPSMPSKSSSKSTAYSSKASDQAMIVLQHQRTQQPAASLQHEQLSELLLTKDNETNLRNASAFDVFLCAHANYTMMKLFQSFMKSNVISIVKTSSLLNNIISFSRDQLKQKSGLDLHPYEKAYLKDQYIDKTHDTKVAFNIILFLCRHRFLNYQPGHGKSFEWNSKLVIKAINDFIPKAVEGLQKNQAKCSTWAKCHPAEAEACLLKPNVREGSAYTNLNSDFWLKKCLIESQEINELISKPVLIQERAFDFSASFTSSSDSQSQGGLSGLSKISSSKKSSIFNTSMGEAANNFKIQSDSSNSMMVAEVKPKKLEYEPNSKNNMSQQEEQKQPLQTPPVTKVKTIKKAEVQLSPEKLSPIPEEVPNKKISAANLQNAKPEEDDY